MTTILNLFRRRRGKHRTGAFTVADLVAAEARRNLWTDPAELVTQIIPATR